MPLLLSISFVTESSWLKGYKRYNVNYGAVWGVVSIGQGAASLNESMAHVEIPGITVKQFVDIERQLDEAWQRKK